MIIPRTCNFFKTEQLWSEDFNISFRHCLNGKFQEFHRTYLTDLWYFEKDTDLLCTETGLVSCRRRSMADMSNGTADAWEPGWAVLPSGESLPCNICTYYMDHWTSEWLDLELWKELNDSISILSRQNHKHTFCEQCIVTYLGLLHAGFESSL